VDKVPTLPVKDEKFKDPTDVAFAFNNFFKTITEKLNVQQRQKGDATSILKIYFLETFPAQK
jgi:hypothetical protein